MTASAPGDLRARRQARTRAAIVATAIELFTDHGFDNVTVSDIARRAEVGRTTFFRYFKDKSDVLFADDDALGDTLVQAADHAARAATAHPGGEGSLAHALTLAHTAMRALTARVAAYAGTLPAYDRLIRDHDGLLARSLLKQQQYMDDLAAALGRHRIPAPTATLAAQLALACYRTAYAAHVSTPDRLVTALDEAFADLFRLGEGPGAGQDRSGNSSPRPTRPTSSPPSG